MELRLKNWTVKNFTKASQVLH